MTNMTDIKETKAQKEARLATNHDLSVAFMRHMRDFLGLKNCYITTRTSVKYDAEDGRCHTVATVDEVPLDSEPFVSVAGIGKTFSFTDMDLGTWKKQLNASRVDCSPYLKLEMYGNRAFREVVLYGVPENNALCYTRFIVRKGKVFLPISDGLLTDFEKKAKKEMQIFNATLGCKDPSSLYETTKKAMLALDDDLLLRDIAEKMDALIAGNVPCPGEMMKAIRDAIMEKEA